MEPLSCVNCLHNPLQLGGVGTAFGYCTAHRVVLHESHHTTCGQLLRKDLLSVRATAEQKLHRRSFHVDFVQELTSPRERMSGATLVLEFEDQAVGDDVFADVAEYGLQLTAVVAAPVAEILASPSSRGPRAWRTPPAGTPA